MSTEICFLSRGNLLDLKKMTSASASNSHNSQIQISFSLNLKIILNALLTNLHTFPLVLVQDDRSLSNVKQVLFVYPGREYIYPGELTAWLKSLAGVLCVPRY